LTPTVPALGSSNGQTPLLLLLSLVPIDHTQKKTRRPHTAATARLSAALSPEFPAAAAVTVLCRFARAGRLPGCSRTRNSLPLNYLRNRGQTAARTRHAYFFPRVRPFVLAAHRLMPAPWQRSSGLGARPVSLGLIPRSLRRYIVPANSTVSSAKSRDHSDHRVSARRAGAAAHAQCSGERAYASAWPRVSALRPGYAASARTGAACPFARNAR